MILLPTGRPRAICGQRYPLPCFVRFFLWEWAEAGQRPRRGRSPVEHRGTFVRPAQRSLLAYFSGSEGSIKDATKNWWGFACAQLLLSLTWVDWGSWPEGSLSELSESWHCFSQSGTCAPKENHVNNINSNEWHSSTTWVAGYLVLFFRACHYQRLCQCKFHCYNIKFAKFVEFHQ